MVEVFFAAFVGFVCLGYAWYVGIAVLRHGDKADAALRARIDKLIDKLETELEKRNE